VLLVEAGGLPVVLAGVQEEALALEDDAQVRVDLERRLEMSSG
jgi:hypothetical protein